MKRELEDSLMYPPLEELRKRIPQKYELVLVATRRAKQLIREQRLNPGSIAVGDRGKKPLTIALLDIVQGRVDKEALLAPDLELDTFEEEHMDYFPEYEGLRTPPREFSAEAEGDDSYIDEELDDTADEPDDVELDDFEVEDD
jgi:DNA-directed RNA polymerase omega subunit